VEGEPLRTLGPDSRQFAQLLDQPRHRFCKLRQSRLLVQRFRNWFRPNPDFLWSLVVPSNCMRLSVKKAAHNCSRLVPRCRKSGKAKDLFVVFSQGKPLLAIFNRAQ
jgi:hypothetical protein